MFDFAVRFSEKFLERMPKKTMNFSTFSNNEVYYRRHSSHLNLLAYNFLWHISIP